MAQTVELFFFLLPLLLVSTVVQAWPKHRPLHHQSRARSFIQLQCRATRYPDLCTRYLSFHAHKFTTTPSHQQLDQIALAMSLARAELTRAYVTLAAKDLSRAKAKDYRAVMQCLDQINDGVDQLSNSIKEIQKMKEGRGRRSDFIWRASNVQTWMSTAVTDAIMCLEGFPGQAVGGKTKAVIKAKVLNLQQTTSIALALFNRFAARYMSFHPKKPKVL